MDIKRRLPLTIAILVAVPLLFLNIILYVVTSQAMLTNARAYLDSLAGIEAGQTQAFLSVELASVRRAAGLETVRHRLQSVDPPIVRSFQAFMADHRRDSGKDRLSLLLDASGTVVAADVASLVGKNLSNYQFFGPLRHGPEFISQVFNAPYDLSPVIAVGAAIQDEQGKPAGYFVHLLPIAILDYLTKEIYLGHTGYGYLIDAHGVIITHPDPARRGTMTENVLIINQIHQESLVSRSVQDNPSEYKSYRYRGELKYMGFRKMADSGWYLVISQTVSEIQAPVSQILAISLGTLLLMVLAGIFLAIRFSRFIIRPIGLLSQTVAEIARGNLDTSCQYDAPNELGTLVRHLNHMIGQLRESHLTIQARDQALVNSEIRYRLAVEGSNDAVYEWKPGYGLLYISGKYEELVGLPELSLPEILQDFQRAIFPQDLENLKLAVAEHLQDRQPYFRVEVRVLDQSGEIRWLLIRGKAHRDEMGIPERLAGSVTNITDRRNKEERIRSLAFRDQLTGLPNRQAYIEHAGAIFTEYASRGLFSGVALLDIDDFRKINDALGHGFGDQILIQVAGRLETAAAGGQVYRFGSDEFIIVFPGMADRAGVDALALELLDCLHSGIQCRGKSFFLNMTVGVCRLPHDSNEVLEILRKADTAMYAAKRDVKHRLAFYSQEMFDGLNQRIQLESLLRQALQANQLELHYQALVDMADLRLVGFEALLRLPDPEGGFVSADKIIPIAEKSGLIHQLGFWVIAEVCRQMVIWDQQGNLFDYISLNVSASQFHDPLFAELLCGIVREHGVSPARIQIEITETVLMESSEMVAIALDQIRSAGFRIALDDFGTGYSSLSYLKTIPLTSLKMDKNFVHDIAAFPRHSVIADGIIQMAKNLGLEVVAEGIETRNQFKLLAGMGCTIAQGYLFSPARPPAELVELIAAGFRSIQEPVA